ncbi:MAG: hypothetical protein V1734_02610 [Nanoarchaeota archaeon]
MKKGIVQSIGLMMLAGLLLSFAVIIFHDTQSRDERFGEMMLYDRLYDLDKSIQYGFVKILSANGISLSADSSHAEITETLPGSSSLSYELDGFSSFLQSRYASSPIVSFDSAIMDNVKANVPIIIKPHNITISHTSYPGGNLEIIPSSLNLDNYTISIESSKSTISFNSGGMTSGSFPVSVSVKISYGTSLWSGNINPALSNTLLLDFDAALPSAETATIIITNPAHLLINRGDMGFSQHVSIGLQNIGNNGVTVSMPEGLFAINFETNKLSIKSTVRMA